MGTKTIALLLCVVAAAIWLISSVSKSHHKAGCKPTEQVVMRPTLPPAKKEQSTELKPCAPTPVKRTFLPEKDRFARVDLNLSPDDFLNRIDAKSWYLNRNETILAQIIDDLNVRSCKSLTISADGSVHIEEDDTDQVIVRLEEFPHHMNWPELCQLLAEDEIKASITAGGIQLSWFGGV